MCGVLLVLQLMIIPHALERYGTVPLRRVLTMLVELAGIAFGTLMSRGGPFWVSRWASATSTLVAVTVSPLCAFAVIPTAIGQEAGLTLEEYEAANATALAPAAVYGKVRRLA